MRRSGGHSRAEVGGPGTTHHHSLQTHFVLTPLSPGESRCLCSRPSRGVGEARDDRGAGNTAANQQDAEEVSCATGLRVANSSCSSEPDPPGRLLRPLLGQTRWLPRASDPNVVSQEGKPVSVCPEDPVPWAAMGPLPQTLHLAQRLGYCGRSSPICGMNK